MEGTLKRVKVQLRDLGELFTDVQYDIYAYLIIMHSGLTVEDINMLGQTNKQLYDLLHNASFWRNKYIDRFLMKKKSVTTGERTGFLKKIENDESNKDNKDLSTWDYETEIFKNPFVHYMAKALARDEKKLILKKDDEQVRISSVGHYDRIPKDVVNDDVFLKNTDVNTITYLFPKNFETFNLDFIFSPEKFHYKYEPAELAYQWVKTDGRTSIVMYVPHTRKLRVIYNLLLRGFKVDRGVFPEDLKTCITCQLEQATLKDRITGLIFCSESCFNKLELE
jgi:hypothetical protein